MISQGCSQHKGPELLLDLVHHSANVVRGAGLPAETAKNVAIEIATRMAEQWGGNQIYFPRGKGTWNSRQLFCAKMEEQDWKIYHEYNGTNRHEVCLRHGISISRLYQIIAAIRRRRSTQPPLLISKKAAIDG